MTEAQHLQEYVSMRVTIRHAVPTASICKSRKERTGQAGKPHLAWTPYERDVNRDRIPCCYLNDFFKVFD